MLSILTFQLTCTPGFADYFLRVGKIDLSFPVSWV
jgi:hypothetical protein